MTELNKLINSPLYPLGEKAFRSKCRDELDKKGILVLTDFLTPQTISKIQNEGHEKINQAYFCTTQHSVYLDAPDDTYPMDHPRNRHVVSSKGCITDDEIDENSPLRQLYNNKVFQSFLCDILGIPKLYKYADPYSSLNIHYAKTGQELGWHFDNSSFAITLMLEAPKAGGDFQYVNALRNWEKGEMNFDGVDAVLKGKIKPESVNLNNGSLVVFRGRNTLHRVLPVEGDRTRMLAVLAYNVEEGIFLSPQAQKTFYGKCA